MCNCPDSYDLSDYDNDVDPPLDQIYLVVKITPDPDNSDFETKENICFYYNNYPKTKAIEFCDKKNKILSLTNRFDEKLGELDFEEPVFLESEPVKNKELIAQLVLATQDGNSKNRRKAGREIQKYNTEFKDRYEKWQRQKDSFFRDFLKGKLIELMSEDLSKDQIKLDEEINDILDCFNSKEYLSDSRYEVETIQAG